MNSSSHPFLFHAVVSSSNPGTFAVQVDPKGSDANAPIMQGIPLASVFATGLGFRETFLPPIGANVLCLQINTHLCYILGIIPDHDKGQLDYPSRAALKAGGDNVYDGLNTVGYDGVTKAFAHNNCRPTDVTEGDIVWANDFGVLLGAFQQVAMLKGSELAQVQAFLLDDLVRIVSHNYEHFTAMGEMKVAHDGKDLILEMGATHLSQESLGVAKPVDDTAEAVFNEIGSATPDDKVDFYEHIQGEKRVKAIERFKLFIGRLADFIQLYVVRPKPGVTRDLSGGTDEPDTGMFRGHISLDGGLHIQTVSRCHIEKTNWIRVPERVYSPDDPDGDDAEDITYDEKSLYDFDKTHTYRDNPFLYFLQLRNYNAYLNKTAYQNFDKHEKDFKTASDTTNEVPLESIEKVDSNTPTNFKDFTLRTSGIYLMDNGGVMIKDAWGSAIVMEGGNIYIQAAKDEIHQPLRNMIAKVGQNISMAAKKDIDFSSTEEGIRIKAEKCGYIYSNTQGIVIESKAQNDADPDPTDKAIETLGGVVLKSAKGIYTFSDSLFQRVQHDAILKSQNYWMGIDSSTYILNKGDIIITAGNVNMISDGTMNCVGQGEAIFAGSTTILGKEDGQLGVKYDKGNPYVDVIKGAAPTAGIISAFDDIKKIDVQSISQAFREDSIFEDLKFRYLASDKYNLDDKADIIPQTITQQEATLNTDISLSAWTEIEVESTLPFPGKDKFYNFYVTNGLSNLKLDKSELYSKSISSLSESESMNKGSLNDYKVITT